MPPQSFSLAVIQGTDQSWVFPVTDGNGDPLDVSAWTIRGQVRSSVEDPTVLHEWSTTAGNLVAAAGQFTLNLSAAESSAWAWRGAVYDIEGTSPSNVTARLVQGGVTVSPEVTRD